MTTQGSPSTGEAVAIRPLLVVLSATQGSATTVEAAAKRPLLVALSARAVDLHRFHRGKIINTNITFPYQSSWLFTIRTLNSRHDLKSISH
jgi:hypothetical protein